MNKRTKPSTPTQSLTRSKGKSSPPHQGSRPKMLRISKAAVMDENEDPPLDLEPSGVAAFPSTSSTENSVEAPSPNRFAALDEDDEEDDDNALYPDPNEPELFLAPSTYHVDTMSVDSKENSATSSVATTHEITAEEPVNAHKPRTDNIPKKQHKKTKKNKLHAQTTPTKESDDDDSLIDEAIAHNNTRPSINKCFTDTTYEPTKQGRTRQTPSHDTPAHDESTDPHPDHASGSSYHKDPYEVPAYRDHSDSSNNHDDSSVKTPPDIFSPTYNDTDDDMEDQDYQPPDNTPGENPADRLRYTKKSLYTEIGELLADRKRDLDDVTKHLHFLQPPSDPQYPRKPPPPTATPTVLSQNPPSYLDAARLNTMPDAQPTFLPNAPDRNRSIRYGMKIVIPKHSHPMESLLKTFKRMFNIVRTSTGPIGIGTWDHEDHNSPVLKRSSDIPDSTTPNKDKNFIQKYLGTWLQFNHIGEFTAHLKIRFVTSHPEKLNFPLDEIGAKLAEDLLSECKDPKTECQIILYRQPSSCQAKKILCIGWLMGSVKSIREDTFTQSVREVLNIPAHVAIGVSWRVIKQPDKKNYPWGEENEIKPPMALHLEIEEEFGPLYTPKLFNLFKKRGKGKVLGLQPRLIMCFSNPAVTGKDKGMRDKMVKIAGVQQRFAHLHTVRLPTNSFIASIDGHPIEYGDSSWTLRRFIMKQAPRGKFSQRLFVTVDLHWSGKGYELVTVRPFFDEAQQCANNLIPECLHTFGAAASLWFTSSGLYTFQDVVWNPDSRQLQSMDTEIDDFFDEDYFGMDTDLQDDPETTRPTATTPTARAALLNPTSQATTAGELIRQREMDPLRGDASIASFGLLGGDRERDGDTVQTARPLDSATPANLHTPTVRIDLSGMELLGTKHPSNEDADAQTMSTMGRTTGETRKKLKSVTKQNDELIAENERAGKTNDQLESENARLLLELQEMRRAHAGGNRILPTVSLPSAKRTSFAIDITPRSLSSDTDSSAASPSGGGGE